MSEMDPSSSTTSTEAAAAAATAGDGWSSPIARGLYCMVCFAVLYEPVRQVLLHAQSSINVGGVGGVGGLANLAGPEPGDPFCTHPNDAFEGQYCYERGYWGGPFTPFQIVTLCFWIGPLLVACGCAYIFAACIMRNGNGGSSLNDTTSSAMPHPTVEQQQQQQQNNQSPKRAQEWLKPVWFGFNVIWFTVPLIQFAFGLKEIEERFARFILTLALAACHPLSWCLSLVMIPTGGIVSKLILPKLPNDASSKQHWFAFHKLLGYTTAFWGMIHGGCELVYLVTSKKRFQNAFAVNQSGEALLYWAGFVTLITLAIHATTAYLRRKVQTPGLFQKVHRIGAAVLLLAASTHWWPFGLFLLPATAMHGISFAASARKIARFSIKQACLLLGLALLAGLLMGLVPVWWLRQVYMQSPHANLYVPFVFPPLAVTMEWLASFLCTKLALSFLCNNNWDENNDDDDDDEPTEQDEAQQTLEDGQVTARTPLLSDSEQQS